MLPLLGILCKDCPLSSDRILAMCKLLCGFACPFLGSIKFTPVFLFNVYCHNLYLPSCCPTCLYLLSYHHLFIRLLLCSHYSVCLFPAIPFNDIMCSTSTPRFSTAVKGFEKNSNFVSFLQIHFFGAFFHSSLIPIKPDT